MSYARIPTRNAQGVKRFTYPVRLGRVVERGPAEPEPMSAMHPVTLGVLLPRSDLGPTAGVSFRQIGAINVLKDGSAPYGQPGPGGYGIPPWLSGNPVLPVSMPPTPSFGGSDSGPTWGEAYSPAGTVPVPANYPKSHNYFASDGSVWVYDNVSGWVNLSVGLPQTVRISMPPTPALNTQPGTDVFVPPGTPAVPLPPSSPSAATVAAQTTITPLVATPATQPPPYVLITQQPGQAPGITISNAPGQLSVFDQISTWLGSDTWITGVQNMWLVGGAIVIWLMLQGRRR